MTKLSEELRERIVARRDSDDKCQHCGDVMGNYAADLAEQYEAEQEKRDALMLLKIEAWRCAGITTEFAFREIEAALRGEDDGSDFANDPKAGTYAPTREEGPDDEEADLHGEGCEA